MIYCDIEDKRMDESECEKTECIFLDNGECPFKHNVRESEPEGE
jgi:hypothetical protein